MISSILILGPTGAGKTPLGEEIEKEGFLGKRAFHFDFGENLRKALTSDHLPEKEKILIKSILNEGRLLKPEEFYLAELLLKHFLTSKKFSPTSDYLILNGLPRNLFQANKLQSFLLVKYLIFLQIDKDTLLKRIALDPAKDRLNRTDDTPLLIEKKLTWFFEENLPLLNFYKERGAKIIKIKVEVSDTGASLFNKVRLFLERV